MFLHLKSHFFLDVPSDGELNHLPTLLVILARGPVGVRLAVLAAAPDGDQRLVTELAFVRHSLYTCSGENSGGWLSARAVGWYGWHVVLDRWALEIILLFRLTVLVNSLPSLPAYHQSSLYN